MRSLPRLRGVPDRLERAAAARKIRRQVRRVESRLSERDETSGPPVLFFNASSRIHTLSLNAAFSLLAAWAVRLAGTPVRYVVCQRGLEQCVLGFQQHDYQRAPPCKACIHFSDQLFPARHVTSLTLHETAVANASRELEGFGMQELAGWHAHGLPLGELCLPSLRWMLRRHHLPDDDPTRSVFRQVLRSAASLALELEGIYRLNEPRAVVLFNGIMYPEAVARGLAKRRQIPVITHEVGLRPGSAHFSHELATFRTIDLEKHVALTQNQEDRLDEYLERRRRGNFSMAGIRFWPKMEPPPAWLQTMRGRHQQMVTVFTNVVFDTSQVHANVLFKNMFDWLDTLGPVIRLNPDTLFVIRAHPDEDRSGKESQESVAAWYQESGLAELPNVAFLSPRQYVSSYELIEESKFVLVYSSSIGLEAGILGVPVLCAGRARYVQVPAVVFPDSTELYAQRLETWVRSPRARLTREQIRSARSFMFHELYEASLDLSHYLEPYPSIPGMVTFSEFDPTQLETDPRINVLRRGILDDSPFAVESPADRIAEGLTP